MPFRRHLASLLVIAAAAAVHADDVVDRSSWDVDAPLGPSGQFTLDTDEGTWMNVDVHPDGELIVFDLLGDLYLLPIGGGEASAITEGAAYDIQPRFSPDGSKLLFTSDRGSRYANWIADFDGEGLSGHRAVQDGNADRWGSGQWDASGDWVFARKRITDVSSIGISEMWLFHADGGSGVQLVADGAEVDAFNPTSDGRYVFYSASPAFSYGRNPHTGIWTINRYDRETGDTRIVSQGPGSSTAPELSPDGRRIAFVRRVGTRSTLWVHDLENGSERQIWDGLDRDQIEGFAPHNVYPGYDWMPDGDSVVIWAGGKIRRVAADGSGAETIPFRVETEVTYHEPLRSERDPSGDTLKARLIRWPVVRPGGGALVFNALGHLYWMTLPNGTPERVTGLDALEFAPSFSPDGSTLAFTTWSDDDGATLRTLRWQASGPAGNPRTIHASETQLVNPAWSADGTRMLVVAGSGANLRGEDLGSELRHDILLVDPRGQDEAEFVISTANRGSQRRITRPTFAANGERIYYYDDEGGGGDRGSRTPPKTALASVKTDGTDRRVHVLLRYAQEAIVSPDESLVAFTELHDAYVMPLPRGGKPVEFDPNSASLAFERVTQFGGEWVNWSPAGDYLTFGFADTVTRLPVDELEFSAELDSRDVGDDGTLVAAVSVGADGRYTFDGSSFGLDGLEDALAAYWENAARARVDVTLADDTPWSDWKALSDWLDDVKVASRLIEDDEGDEDGTDSAREDYRIDLEVARAKPDGRVAFTGARIITMNGDEVIENGTIVVDGNRISQVGASASMTLPNDLRTFDVSGQTIMPGLVDVHAHMGYGVLDVNPQKEWRYYANLAYGVTTTHDPSASTHTVFSQAEMIEAGIMTGPRIFSTGFILYGALNSDMAVIGTYDDALAHVRRLKQLGGFSVKSYMQPRRDQRQWIVRAARSEDMLVFPEGGGNLPDNVNMIMDGHSGIEHSLSVADIYRDVVELFANSRAGYSPTMLVAYGGQSGENWFYQHHDVWENDKLQSFFPPRQIDARARRRVMAAEDDFNHKAVARGLTQVSEAGGLVVLGAHGQLQGLGAHWELWAMTQGGMDNHDALRAATINGAEYLGMDRHLGTLEPGKLADFIVLDDNPLEDIEHSESIRMTIANGVVYDSDSMDELWPNASPRGDFYFRR